MKEKVQPEAWQFLSSFLIFGQNPRLKAKQSSCLLKKNCVLQRYHLALNSMIITKIHLPSGASVDIIIIHKENESVTRQFQHQKKKHFLQIGDACLSKLLKNKSTSDGTCKLCKLYPHLQYLPYSALFAGTNFCERGNLWLNFLISMRILTNFFQSILRE